MRIVYVFLEPSPKPHVRSTTKDQEPVYDQNTSYPSNPFDEADTEMDSSQHGNPFDEPEPEPQPKVSPPRSSKRKNVRPVDMSKYLYANTTKTEEEELDEWVKEFWNILWEGLWVRAEHFKWLFLSYQTSSGTHKISVCSSTVH